MRTIRIDLVALSLLACAAVAAPDAQAQDEPLPGYGPTSIAVPAGWARGAPQPRLVRAPPAPPAGQRAPVQFVPTAPRVARRGYDITSGPWRPRGPVEVRDEWILAQPRMTLPAVSPDAPRHGSWTVGFHIDRGSDFGWSQSGPAEFPTDRRFIVDGEHQSTEVRVRYGLLPRLSLGLRVPVYWRGGGFMDDIIDWYHDLFEGTLKDNDRPSFDNDQYRVHGRTPGGDPLSWDDKRGTALGNIDLEAYWHIKKACCRSDWRVAWIARAALPTGGDPYDSGFDLGTQFVVAKQLGRRFDFYAGLGATWYSDDTLDGIEYEPFRGHGFAALEWHATSCWSFILETNAASRLVTNLAAYPAESWYINFSTRFDVSRAFEIYAGFTENIIDQQGTVDFGAFAGFTLKL